MKILYIAKHGQQNNDDEGAIHSSLINLGHHVDRFQLNNLLRDRPILSRYEDYDFVLFHKLPSQDYIDYVCNRWKGVCWYFDPINKGFVSNDQYISQIKEKIYLGFFTDGDFVISENRKNIQLLRQGLDHSSPTIVMNDHKQDKILDFMFIGTVGHGGYSIRQQYLQQLSQDFSGWLPHTQYSVFKNELTSVCQQTKIMLAMPPVTDNYWSNRIYLLGGRRAFVLHPYASGLEKEFGDSLVLYKDYQDLKEKIQYYLQNDSEREGISRKLQSIILDRHKYYDRCKTLVEKISEYRQK